MINCMSKIIFIYLFVILIIIEIFRIWGTARNIEAMVNILIEKVESNEYKKIIDLTKEVILKLVENMSYNYIEIYHRQVCFSREQILTQKV